MSSQHVRGQVGEQRDWEAGVVEIWREQTDIKPGSWTLNCSILFLVSSFSKHRIKTDQVDYLALVSTNLSRDRPSSPYLEKMYTRTLLALALGAASMAAAKPILTPRNEYVYATFYNDDACTQGAGQPVSVSNPGCLNESGRRSIYFQAGFDDANRALIESAGADCPCQTHCDLIALDLHNSDAFCLPIDLSAYNSLRFIGGPDDAGASCPANNC